ncbi:rap1 GTPase-GDP dissociation stimulator 1-B isoform X2 [Manduca sexta]|uniref:rap1 GTPase-GDP dissociation stimulator 1-B isoform X2 n=1 Tax=Manduca sexta TaxID=7130 RepID=UPI001182F823|nr:rap1 GTPase-GDP dissociation stimulator 1-B isoform X2 [Manduca sexta]
MDGTTTKKSTSLETLVIQNISNVNDLKTKLNEIIRIGKEYEFDVSSCLKSLICNSDHEIVLLSVQAISELVKCEDKRVTYSQKEIIQPILNYLEKDLTSDNIGLIKQCCRALGNLCCDCDQARKIILDCDGVPVIVNLLKRTLDTEFGEIKMFTSKTLLNFCIGGQQFSEAIVQGNVVDVLKNILNLELEKDDMDDDMVSTALLILSVINDNTPEFLYDEAVNTAVLNILKDTTNIEISELCLDHLHAQAEHDSVKTLLANEGGVQTVCSRLEQFTQKHEAGDLNADDSEVETIMKQACDLVIIVLTGDEAMHILYKNGIGEVYLTMVKWLDSPNYNLLTTAVLAIGNFARQDDYCAQMMDDKIFDKLLDIFEIYHGFAVRMRKEPDVPHPIDSATVTKIQHAVLSALRNLTVPVANKRVAAAQGRAAPIFLSALPHIEDHHVAYKLLAAIRMLVDGQEGVAKQLASDSSALASVAKWGHAGEYAGAAGEAPRLLAWAVKQLRHHTHWRHIVEVDGCISSLVNMLVASHSLMQNEAILALTLLAIESLKRPSPDTEQPNFDYEKNFIAQLIKSEIGKHVSVLVDTNCAKMPVEVAENLLAFLDITSKKNKVAFDYKEAKVPESLKKFSDSRTDFSDDLKACIAGVILAINDNCKSG